MPRMPTFFIGHGDPMNALRDNEFTRSLAAAAAALPARPRAILVVSAHWCEGPSKASAAARPETIHDFSGFPDELFRVQYPAPGAPELAQRVASLASGIGIDEDRGLDHGAWTVLRHLFPEADIPVAQLSIDLGLGFPEHLERGQSLAPLRDEGVLLIGSGNIVHNLRRIAWEGMPYPWARDFDEWARERIAARDDEALVAPKGTAFALAAPTVEHYVPLLYALGAAPGEKATTIYEGLQHGSLSMRCVRFG